jgi:hypothetical protein
LKVQAFAAARNAGDCSLMDLGTPMKIPLPYSAELYCAGLIPGGVAVTIGSGKPVTPCLRMHSAVSVACSICCSLACVFGPPPGINFKHAAWAALNDGDCGLMPVPAMLSPPPPPDGSGKFVTPWARMHLLKAIAVSASDLVLRFSLAAPQAASAIAQVSASIATVRSARVDLVGMHPLYATAHNRAVTA